MQLFLEVANRLPDCSFVLVGGSSLPPDWCTAVNVHLLGRKPYDEVADYMAACDVLIMPWLDNEWIRACNPVKLKEYLAVGKPVVSTCFPELDYYDGQVRVAQVSGGVCGGGSGGARCREGSQSRRDFLRGQGWEEKAKLVWGLLKDPTSIGGVETSFLITLSLFTNKRYFVKRPFCSSLMN